MTGTDIGRLTTVSEAPSMANGRSGSPENVIYVRHNAHVSANRHILVLWTVIHTAGGAAPKDFVKTYRR